MQRVVSDLYELQELELVLEESRILHNAATEHETELKQNIETMRSRIPADMLTRYNRLRISGVGVASELKGICGHCRLNVAVGDLNRMRRGAASPVCPNCGVFLRLQGNEV